jgi:sulfhydrogenase subunit beta (sulfur reductase)
MMNTENTIILERAKLDTLFDALHNKGYTIIGPRKTETAIVYDEISSSVDLPIGWTDEQNAAVYRLKRREDAACYGFNVGANSWKKFLFPATLKLFRVERKEKSSCTFIPSVHHESTDGSEEIPKYAFMGIRSCELHALLIQDKIFMGGMSVDPYYKIHRDQTFIVAINCTEAGETCFCASMKTGPRVEDEFDLALTEVIDKQLHYYTIEIGSERGRGVIQNLPCQKAEKQHISKAQQEIDKAASQMGRSMDTTGIKELLYANLEHPRWDDVAKRCLTCTNCTMVCPTCFCSTIEDTNDLLGTHAERWRKWDSCFTMDFSYIHGGSVRPSVKSRYRQWMTHKLANWIDQFGMSGCVGCGRCITWCPVGIDLTEEIRALRESSQQKKPN